MNAFCVDYYMCAGRRFMSFVDMVCSFWQHFRIIQKLVWQILYVFLVIFNVVAIDLAWPCFLQIYFYFDVPSDMSISHHSRSQIDTHVDQSLIHALNFQ